MNPRQMTRRLGMLLCALTPLGVVGAQEPDSFSATQEREAKREKELSKRIVLSLDDIVMHTYHPKHASARSLASLAENLVGRSFWLKERGEIGHSIENLSVLGDGIILYDTPDYTKRMLKTLVQLDSSAPESADDVQDQVTIEYEPRFISLAAAGELLGVEIGKSVHGVRTLHGRHAMQLSGSKRRVAEMRATLERGDVARPAVMLTVYVLRANYETENAPGVPAEVVANLKSMLPQFQFESLGLAILNANIVEGEHLSATVRQSAGVGYELEMEPVAYDRAGGTLTVRKCEFKRRTKSGAEHIFTTNTSLRAGEYTVLGAAGQEPMLVVIRLSSAVN